MWNARAFGRGSCYSQRWCLFHNVLYATLLNILMINRRFNLVFGECLACEFVKGRLFNVLYQNGTIH